MTDREIGFLMVAGGQAAFPCIVVLLDRIAVRQDRRRAEKYERPM